jgi:hypothetical protein
MDESSLKPRDIAMLLKACKINDIESLEYCGLKIQRAKKSDGVELASVRASAEAEKIEHKAFISETLATKEDTVAHMMIEDPLQYEKLLAAGELEDMDEETLD